MRHIIWRMLSCSVCHQAKKPLTSSIRSSRFFLRVHWCTYQFGIQSVMDIWTDEFSMTIRAIWTRLDMLSVDALGMLCDGEMMGANVGVCSALHFKLMFCYWNRTVIIYLHLRNLCASCRVNIFKKTFSPKLLFQRIARGDILCIVGA